MDIVVDAPSGGMFTLEPGKVVRVKTSPKMTFFYWGGEPYCVRFYDERDRPASFQLGSDTHGPDWYCLNTSDIGKAFRYKRGRVLLFEREGAILAQQTTRDNRRSRRIRKVQPVGFKQADSYMGEARKTVSANVSRGPPRQAPGSAPSFFRLRRAGR